MDINNLITYQSLILSGAGFLIGIFSIVIGGGMFFSVPLMQWLFPGATFGAVVGNIKMGSFFRNIGSTISTYKQIEYKQNLQLSAIAFLGTILGASIISGLHQKWLFPAILAAVFFAVYAPKVAHKINKKTYHIVAFLTGVYAGLFGAGIGILLIALLRLKHPKDTDIAFVKIQSRFVEWLLVITAVVTHFLHGNIIPHIWIPWAIGCLTGGYTGGILLNKMGKLSGITQKYILYIAFTFAILVAALKFF